MCGRFALDERIDDAVEEWIAAGGPASAWRPEDWIDPATLVPRYSVAPRQPIAVMHYAGIGTQRRRALSAAIWGLSPAWAKAGGPHPINARLETVATNGLFRTAFRAGRCVVPMSGYFEWQQADDGKDPYYISGDEPLFASAIAASDPDGNPTVAIITRSAVDAAGRVHDRMPVFVPLAAVDEWLIAEGTQPESALTFLDTQSLAVASTLSTRAVSRAINNVRTADPADATLIQQI